MRSADPEVMGRNQYARHRGCSPGAVTFATKDRIKEACVWDGARLAGIRWRQADALWALNTDPAAAEKTGALSRAAGELDLRQPAPASTGDRQDYLEHRATAEKFRAKEAELAYLERIGQLVSAAAVREATFRRYRTLRDKLLNIPDRISTIAAAERDPARLHQIITDEIKRVLNELAGEARAEVQTSAAPNDG